MKKKIIIVISLLVGLLIIYFCYKGFYLHYYDINNITTQDYETFIDNLNIKNTINLKHKNINADEYLEYKNIKIRNDFKNFEELNFDIDTGVEQTKKLILKDENGKTAQAFWMDVTDSYVDILKADKTLFGTGDKRITSTNLTDILDENNISNDIELFNYINKQKQVKNNIFTSIKKMKENYTIQFMTSIIMPVTENITLINGDYNGYIFNLKNNIKEVSILKDNKRYVFVFVGTNYSNEEYLVELLSTIIIN